MLFIIVKFYEHVISRIINLHENGILKYLERKYFNQADHCGADVRADSSPLYITDVWAAFVILGVGLIIPTVCLVVEIMRARMERKVLPGKTQTWWLHNWKCNCSSLEGDKIVSNIYVNICDGSDINVFDFLTWLCIGGSLLSDSPSTLCGFSSQCGEIDILLWQIVPVNGKSGSQGDHAYRWSVLTFAITQPQWIKREICDVQIANAN